MVEPEYKYLVKKEFCPGCPIYFAPIFPKDDPRRAEVRKEMDYLDSQEPKKTKSLGLFESGLKTGDIVNIPTGYAKIYSGGHHAVYCNKETHFSVVDSPVGPKRKDGKFSICHPTYWCDCHKYSQE